MRWPFARVGVGAWAVLALGAAQAATVVGVSPQGEVAQVRQASLRFDAAVVPLGDLRQPDPVAVQCSGPVPPGQGRWANDRNWVLDFADALPPGVRCTLRVKPGWKPVTGTLAGATEWTFSTGGPAVTRTDPWDGSTIAEDQHFLLRLSGPAVPATVAASARCQVEGLADAMPVRVVDGTPRDEILKARRLTKEAARWLLVACQRPLPPGARLRLVWGAGIASAADAKVVTRQEQRFAFEVRKPFAAEFSCEREKAQSPCLPIRPLVVRFSEPVARSVAEAVRLKPAAGGSIAPFFDRDDRAAEVSEVRFQPPLAENAKFAVALPADVRDASGRALSNAASFPLAVATGDAPPLAKFAAAPFGIVERGEAPALPVTLRHVQGDLRPGVDERTAGGTVRIRRIDGDAQMLKTIRQLAAWHEAQLTAKELGLPRDQWTVVEREVGETGRTIERRVDRLVHTREVALLKDEPGTQKLALPALGGTDRRPFEVLGIPLVQPGYQVVEIASRRLGQSLLDRDAPMFVRTGVLVTNLGVHFKRGRENSLVWVTTLDRAKPVAGAKVAINDCNANPLWQGTTDANGLAHAAVALPAPHGCEDGFFVTARATDATGVADVGFVFSGWQRGIEPWRFNHPTAGGPRPDAVAHTVFDRMLLRAGETVAMKHFFRLQTGAGLAFAPPARLPSRLKLVHDGSGQEITQPLRWNGTRHAVSSWNIPPAAKLGRWRVVLVDEEAPDDAPHEWSAGDFRVEEFRVPLLDARLAPPRGALIAPSEVAIGVQLAYQSGGGVAAAPLKATALLRDEAPRFAGYDDYQFVPPRDAAQAERDPDEPPPADGKVVADQLAFTTDRNGAATVTLRDLPAIRRAGRLTTEVTFADPNGEIQTVASTLPVWPAAVVPGIRTGAWASERGKVKFSVVALDTAGKPVASQPLDVQARSTRTLSSRKRLVGGFYAYDNRSETTDLGIVCSGKSDARGLLACEAALDQAGQVELVVSAKDAAGRVAESAATVWITGRDELWFAQGDDDRIDVLPEKRRVAPGEPVRFQVRMPFREATALVTVEREGVVATQVLTLRGTDPTVELTLGPEMAPNAYVGVLVLRGRVRDVPWTSFFRWGWRNPIEWARAWWFEGREYKPPTAMVDLAKPTFKFGVAAIEVGTAANELQVAVTPDQPTYAVRGKAQVTVRVTQNGKPLPAGETAEIAFAAVDEGLLALRENDSWNLLAGLLRQRAWGVETSSAQSEVIGRRHYGRKAVPAGGGGGRGGTRELFDTLLLWRASVPVDANGVARIEVPINDSLTAFRLVAVADAGASKFGTGSATIRVTQDLQILAGLPPLVREGDRFAALLTLRNTTARELLVKASLAGTAIGGRIDALTRMAIVLPPQELRIAAGAAAEVSWPVDVPADATSIQWEAAAEAGTLVDRLKRTQIVGAAVPLRVTQATLMQLDGTLTLPVAPPADALAAGGAPRGGLDVGLQPTLAGGLPGLRRFFQTYPFSCLEQKVSRAVGLRDAALWDTVAGQLPSYLDADGLANYFPPRGGDGPRGSDRLTAYLIQATHEAGFTLPPAALDVMLAGLRAFAEGRIERRFWAPRADLDMRRIAAIEALARHGRADAKLVSTVNVVPNTWPTGTVIEWVSVLKRVKGVPEQAKRLAEAQQILRSRITYAGSTLKFSTEETDHWWWLMDSGDANAAKLVLSVLDDPAWREELPRLVGGALQRQRGGAWATTTANLWGGLALDKFAAKFEATPVAGRTVAQVGGTSRMFDWGASAKGGVLALPWPAAGGANLEVVQQGSGKPWVSVQALAAIPLKEPLRAGYAVARSLEAIEQREKGKWSRGDIVRVKLEIDANSDRTWVVVADPIPAGATVLGSGLGRDALLATRTERREGSGWLAHEERAFDAWRVYYEFLPRGKHVVEYTVRLNNPGRFGLPPTRVEAMYAPETFGELPNALLEVLP
jgi:uncharacterized protein YfaS (alpha-2-macroglobulin family)